MFTHAICRLPGTNFAAGLTTADLGAPDYREALSQHAAYQRALASLGLTVKVLPASLEFPDSTFVEDTAVLFQNLAVFSRPGAESRFGEVELIKPEILTYFSRYAQIAAPGTLDGGDICEAGNHFFIGVSQRTNQDGAAQLSYLLGKEGCTSAFIDIRETPGLLHLKSGIAYLGNRTLVVANALANHPAFDGFQCIIAEEADQYATNCILVNGTVILPSGYPKLKKQIEEAGFAVMPLAMSEFQKMDGGLSCLSLRFQL